MNLVHRVRICNIMVKSSKPLYNWFHLFRLDSPKILLFCIHLLVQSTLLPLFFNLTRKNYKYVKRTRLFPPDSVSDVTGPLTGLFFYITNGPFDSGKTKEQLIRELANLGGAIMSKVCTLTAYVILYCCCVSCFSQNIRER